MDPTETLLLRASATLVAMVMPFLWFFVLRWTLSRSTTTTPRMKSCSLSDFWTTIGLGALCFVLSQAVQLPLAQWLRARVAAASDEEDSYREDYEEDYYNYGPYAAEAGTAFDNFNNNSSSWSGGLPVLLLLGLLAGLCQEGSRWILFRAWGRLFGPSHSRNDNSLKSKKNQHASSHQALLVGAGHGGCQAFWVALTALVTTLVSIVSKDEESASSQEQENDPQDVVDQETPELLFLRSGQGSWAESSRLYHKDHRHHQLALLLLPLLEQACWMALHMALSLVVWNGIVAVAARRHNNNKISGKGVFTFAVVVHTLVDVAAECTKEAVAEGAVAMLWLLALVAVPLSFFSLFRLYRVSVEQDNAMYNNNIGNGLDDYCLDDDDSDHTWEPHLYHSMDGEEDDHYHYDSDNNSSNSEIESDEEQDLFGAGSSTGSVPSLDDEFSLDEAL